MRSKQFEVLNIFKVNCVIIAEDASRPAIFETTLKSTYTACTLFLKIQEPKSQDNKSQDYMSQDNKSAAKSMISDKK
jgi:hypothetical protein